MGCELVTRLGQNEKITSLLTNTQGPCFRASKPKMDKNRGQTLDLGKKRHAMYRLKDFTSFLWIQEKRKERSSQREKSAWKIADVSR